MFKYILFFLIYMDLYGSTQFPGEYELLKNVTFTELNPELMTYEELSNLKIDKTYIKFVFGMFSLNDCFGKSTYLKIIQPIGDFEFKINGLIFVDETR